MRTGSGKRNAYWQGWAARTNGVARSANPFSTDARSRELWDEGWMEGRA